MCGLALIAGALSMVPAVAAGQDVTRIRESRQRALAPLINIYTERQSRTRLGLYLDTEESRRFDGDGALVTGVMRDSPAEDVGLQEGDVITVFEGQVLTIPLSDSDLESDFDLDESLPAQRLLALARDLEDGQTVEIRYLRGGGNNTVTVEAEEFEFPRVRTFGSGPGRVFGVGPDARLWAFPLDADFDVDLSGRMQVLGDQLENMTFGVPDAYAFGYGVTSTQGVEFIDLNPELGEYFGADSGALVVEVDEDSTLGLIAGDVVLAVGAREADSVGRVLRLIRTYEEDEPIRFRVIRNGAELVTEGRLD
jgi:S1-C subfamily serine protease